MRGRMSHETRDLKPPTDLLRKSKTWGLGRVPSLKSIGSCPLGFTLLELILSITILSMIALIIGSGFRLGLNAWKKGDDEAEAVQTMRVLSGLVFQQLKSIYPYKVKVEDEDVVLFKGESDSMIFVTTLSDPYPGGFKWVRYLHKDGVLYYKEGFLPDKEVIDNIPGNEEVLEAYVDEVLFEYYSKDDDEWKESWDFSNTLPGALKLKVSYFQPMFVNIPMSPDDDEEGERAADEI